MAGVLFGVGMAIAAVKFFSLSRQPKCIPIVATQSISSLKSALPGDSWRTLLQTFRTKIFLALSDDYSARTASELCGREDTLKVSYNISESGHDANVSFFTGKTLSNRANVTTSKSYHTHSDFRFDTKTFTETQERPVGNHRLRRLEPDAADLLLFEALLQRCESILF